MLLSLLPAISYLALAVSSATVSPQDKQTPTVSAQDKNQKTQQQQQCGPSLLIDNYASFQNAKNSLGGGSFDDNTMAQKYVSNGWLVIAPRNQNSYYYFNGLCSTAAGNVNGRYLGVEFLVTPPPGTTQMSVNLQTANGGCNSQVSNHYVTLALNPNGGQQLARIPFTYFIQTGADINSVVAVSLENFSGPGRWAIGPLSFYCGLAPPPPPQPTLYPSPDGSCGANTTYTCGNNCCSQYGYCGTSNAYCGTGCQKGYGRCYVASSL